MFIQTRRLLRYAVLPALALLSSQSHAAWPWDPPPPSTPVTPQKQVVIDTIAANQSCKDLGDFYWEMGDANGAITTGQVGSRFNASSVVDLASASKWPFATYLVQKVSTLSDRLIQGLTMRAGYVSMIDPACLATLTVRGCFNSPSALLPINSQRTSDSIDRFNYNSGNFQMAAVEGGLGNMTILSLNQDMRRVMGISNGLSYWHPGVASGLHMSANSYTAMLRKIMTGQLAMGSLLISNRTCTLTGTCPTANRTVLPYDWDYGLGHWIERDARGEDEAYSSIGYNGFYPWISADLQHYGVISMENGFGIAPKALQCGILLRRAWLTGVVQRQ